MKTLTRLLTMALVAAFFGGCTSTPKVETPAPESQAEKTAEVTKEQPESLTVQIKAQLEKSLHIGMTEKEVLAVIGLKPDSVNTTMVGSIEDEQWVYDASNLYIYFENGKLTGWQLSQ